MCENLGPRVASSLFVLNTNGSRLRLDSGRELDYELAAAQTPPSMPHMSAILSACDPGIAECTLFEVGVDVLDVNEPPEIVQVRRQTRD